MSWITPAIGIIGAALGAVLGAAISYFVQTKTQRNAWKREYSVKIVETVYSFLYTEVKEIAALIKQERLLLVSFNKWREFQSDHRHLQVQPDMFRLQFDLLLKEVDRYDADLQRLLQEVLPQVVNEASMKVFHLVADSINVEVKFKQPSGFDAMTYNALDCLRMHRHPRQLIMESYPRSEILSVSAQFHNVRETIGLQPTSVDEAKFEEFWKLCLEFEKENEICDNVLLEQKVLLTQSEGIFEELTKRIEEPWRI